MTPRRCPTCGAPGQKGQCNYCHTAMAPAAEHEDVRTECCPLLEGYTVEEGLIAAVRLHNGPVRLVVMNHEDLYCLYLSLGSRAIWQSPRGVDQLRLITPRGVVVVLGSEAVEQGQVLLS